MVGRLHHRYPCSVLRRHASHKAPPCKPPAPPSKRLRPGLPDSPKPTLPNDTTVTARLLWITTFWSWPHFSFLSFLIFLGKQLDCLKGDHQSPNSTTVDQRHKRASGPLQHLKLKILWCGHLSKPIPRVFKRSHSNPASFYPYVFDDFKGVT